MIAFRFETNLLIDGRRRRALPTALMDFVEELGADTVVIRLFRKREGSRRE
jgi:hypothetical protein